MLGLWVVLAATATIALFVAGERAFAAAVGSVSTLATAALAIVLRTRARRRDACPACGGLSVRRVAAPTSIGVESMAFGACERCGARFCVTGRVWRPLTDAEWRELERRHLGQLY